MRHIYEIANFTFRPLALGLQYKALDSHDVDVADVFTADPQLASGKYTLPADPRNIFGFQNIALALNNAELAQLGGQTFVNIIEKVNALLTTRDDRYEYGSPDRQPIAGKSRPTLLTSNRVI